MKFFLSLVSCLLLLVFLWWHWQLGLTRYFDVDEFAHLSWAYQMLSGRKPYVDFLFFFPPGFHLFLMPLFALGSGVTPIIAGRLVQFGIFVLLVGVTMLLFWLMRKSWVAILAGVFLAFLPLPFDKYLEIRPDTLAVLFAMLGMVFQILALKGVTLRGRVTPYQILSGIFYGLSLLILPKTLPQVGVAIGVLTLMDVGKKLCKWRHGRDGNYNTLPFLVGLAAPLTLFGLWVLTLGNLDQVIYSLTMLPVEANKISQTFIMMPDLFFYPNATFYGEPGWSMGLIANHAIWLIAIFMAAYRLVAPYLTVKSEIRTSNQQNSKFEIRNSKQYRNSNVLNSKRLDHLNLFRASNFVLRIYNSVFRASNFDRQAVAWSEFLIAATFFVYALFYVQIVPLKHTQYLIPIAVFVAFYAADAVDMLWQKFKAVNILTVVFLLTASVGLYALWSVFVSVNTPKLAWTNADTIKELTILFRTIPTSEYILDLTGQTIYYKHPYVACCLPVGQWTSYLTRPIPSLSEALKKTKTKYIFEGGLTRTNTLLPEDQVYVSAHYLPHPAIAGLLLRK